MLRRAVVASESQMRSEETSVGRVELQEVFKEQAEWQREKAKQHPADKRYPEAAAVFDQLAATVNAIPKMFL